VGTPDITPDDPAGEVVAPDESVPADVVGDPEVPVVLWLDVAGTTWGESGSDPPALAPPRTERPPAVPPDKGLPLTASMPVIRTNVPTNTTNDPRTPTASPLHHGRRAGAVVRVGADRRGWPTPGRSGAFAWAGLNAIVVATTGSSRAPTDGRHFPTTRRTRWWVVAIECA
jgi:hypothetical protein